MTPRSGLIRAALSAPVAVAVAYALVFVVMAGGA